MSDKTAFDGECTGRVATSPRNGFGRIRWKDGVICAFDIVDEPADPQAAEHWILPPFFDPQVNGFAGVDFQQDDLSDEQLLRAVRELRRHACSKILLTLITDEWPRLMKRLARVKKLRDANPELCDAIVGWHIEGPFLSEKPGFCGAHAPELMLNATDQHIHELRDTAGGDPVLLTMAPERPGAIAEIEFAVKQGIVVSLGHTDASSAELAAAVSAGAKGFTHLGNGCPRTLDRQDNILWRALNQPGLTYGVIPDGIHVSPDLFRIFHQVTESRALADLDNRPELYFTTDAMAAAGAPPGQYRIGRLNLEVGADRVVRLPGQNLFAGSALTPLEGYRIACRMIPGLGVNHWDRFASSAWKMMNLPEDFDVGHPADFCHVRFGRNREVKSGELYVRGVPTPLHIEPREA